MLQRLKLLRRLQAVKRSPDEAWALLERVKTHTRSADDRERFAHRMQVTTEVTDHRRTPPDVQTPPGSQWLSPRRKATRQRQLAQAARRRHRRER